MAAYDFSDYEWLTSVAAAPLLRDLQEKLGNGGQVDVRLAASLRKSQSASRTHLLLEQVELRNRARAKFSQPERMFFTRKGLEQSTDEAIAGVKARRFAALKVEQPIIADLCCGIGGDLLALAGLGTAHGYDSDAVSALFATRNLDVLVRATSRALATKAATEAVTGASAWHIDPDRRPTGERTIELADYEPGPEFLQQLLTTNPNGGVKISPAADVNEPTWTECEREWLGSRGECRQQVLWFGGLATNAGQHVATVVDSAGKATSFAGDESTPITLADNIAAYVYEPDATVLAAHLAGAFAQQHELLGITSGGGYLTGDRKLLSSLLATFRVRDVLPFDVKKLKAYCRERNLGQLEIKKRNVELEPFRLRREIMAKGDEAAVIFVTPFAGSVKAIIADRIVS